MTDPTGTEPASRGSGVTLDVALDGGWRLGIWLVMQSGRLVVAEVRVFPDANGDDREPDESRADASTVPPGGITTATLRSIRLGEIIDAERRKLAAHFQSGGGSRVTIGDRTVDIPQDWSAVVRQEQPGWIDAVRFEPRRPGAAGRDPGFYAAGAAAYSSLVERGCGAPILAIRDALRLDDGEPPDEAAVRRWLRRARRDGYLTPDSAPGISDGRITDLGQQVLDEAKREGRL